MFTACYIHCSGKPGIAYLPNPTKPFAALTARLLTLHCPVVHMEAPCVTSERIWLFSNDITIPFCCQVIWAYLKNISLEKMRVTQKFETSWNSTERVPTKLTWILQEMQQRQNPIIHTWICCEKIQTDWYVSSIIFVSLSQTWGYHTPYFIR